MRYVAIGDSFTEGVGDEPPGRGPRGWADLVAQGLAAGGDEPVFYANLAVRGRLLEPIVNDQLDAALSLDPPPDLLTMNGGGNDILRPGADLDHLTALTERAVDRTLGAGVRPVLVSGGDPSNRLPFGSRFREKVEVLVEATKRIAKERDVLFVNCFADLDLRDPGYWSVDRLHLNPNGHHRVAILVLEALGVSGASSAPGAPFQPRQGVRAETRFYLEHVLPWFNRRLRRRSSGDGMVGKHLDWNPVEVALPDPDLAG